MTSIKNMPPQLPEFLERQNQELNLAIQLFEMENFQESAKHAEICLKTLQEALDVIHKNYLEGLKKSKLPSFEQDNDLAHELQQKEFHQKNQTELMDLLIRVEKYSSIVKNEQKRLFPRPILIPKFFQSNKILFTSIGSALVLILIGNLFWKQHISAQRGLMATYYKDVELKDVYLTKKVPNIDFNWGKGRALPKWKKDFFSIRFEGYLKIPTTAEYQFQTLSDDGVRLTIGNNTLINNWTKHGPTIDRANITLEKGYHQIRLEYFEWDRPAMIKLFWKPEKKSTLLIIPQKNFFPSKTQLKSNSPIFEIPPSTL